MPARSAEAVESRTPGLTRDVEPAVARERIPTRAAGPERERVQDFFALLNQSRLRTPQSH